MVADPSSGRGTGEGASGNPRPPIKGGEVSGSTVRGKSEDTRMSSPLRERTEELSTPPRPPQGGRNQWRYQGEEKWKTAAVPPQERTSSRAPTPPHKGRERQPERAVGHQGGRNRKTPLMSPLPREGTGRGSQAPPLLILPHKGGVVVSGVHVRERRNQTLQSPPRRGRERGLAPHRPPIRRRNQWRRQEREKSVAAEAAQLAAVKLHLQLVTEAAQMSGVAGELGSNSEGLRAESPSSVASARIRSVSFFFIDSSIFNTLLLSLSPLPISNSTEHSVIHLADRPFRKNAPKKTGTPPRAYRFLSLI